MFLADLDDSKFMIAKFKFETHMMAGNGGHTYIYIYIHMQIVSLSEDHLQNGEYPYPCLILWQYPEFIRVIIFKSVDSL